MRYNKEGVCWNSYGQTEIEIREREREGERASDTTTLTRVTHCELNAN